MSRSVQAYPEDESDIIGPILPSQSDKLIGPALPPNYQFNESSSGVTDTIENVFKISNDVYGPTLPENLQKKAFENNSDSKTYGPLLPPSCLDKRSSDVAVLSDRSVVEDDLSHNDIYGPLPPGLILNSRAHEALEERALEIKLSGLSSKKCTTGEVREEWMIELPKIGSGSLGLGTKHFRKNDRPDFSDRSSWTDTPQDKANKLHGKTEKNVDVRETAELREAKKRDKEQSKMAREYKKKHKRDDSLLELHRSKLLKKQKKNEGEASVRRPFNRETDLKVNVFDEAQKKVMLKKAMHLDDRFSKGQTKFL